MIDRGLPVASRMPAAPRSFLSPLKPGHPLCLPNVASSPSFFLPNLTFLPNYQRPTSYSTRSSFHSPLLPSHKDNLKALKAAHLATTRIIPCTTPTLSPASRQCPLVCLLFTQDSSEFDRETESFIPKDCFETHRPKDSDDGPCCFTPGYAWLQLIRGGRCPHAFQVLFFLLYPRVVRSAFLSCTKNIMSFLLCLPGKTS